MQKLLGLFLVFVIVSCGKPPKTHYYTLDLTIKENQMNDKAPVLFVEPAKSEPIFDQDRFVYKTSDYAVNFDHYKRWVDSPTSMLTAQTIAFLRASGLFSHVAPNAPFAGNILSLSTHLRQFHELAVDSRRNAVVEAFFSLYNYETKNIIWEGTIQSHIPIQTDKEDAVAEAMSKAVENVLDQLVDKLSSLR